MNGDSLPAILRLFLPVREAIVEHHNTFLGLTAEGWTGLGTMILALATLVLAIVGLFQLSAIRDDTQLDRTLNACLRYETDPILDGSTRKLSKAWREGMLNKREAAPPDFRPDIVTVMNFLDNLAVGIEEGVYNEGVVRNRMENVVKFHYEQYLGPDAPHIEDLGATDYVKLAELYRAWTRPQGHFRVKSRLPWQKEESR